VSVWNASKDVAVWTAHKHVYEQNAFIDVFETNAANCSSVMNVSIDTYVCILKLRL
jgi:hypothetical protein